VNRLPANCKPTPSRPFDKLRASSDADGRVSIGHIWSLAPEARQVLAKIRKDVVDIDEPSS
jgi:hypothetical protein